MQEELIKVVARKMHEIADEMSAGNSRLSEESLMTIASVLTHRPMSMEAACKYLNMSRSKFTTKVSQGLIPKGRKQFGWKELCWYEDELEKCKTKL